MFSAVSYTDEETPDDRVNLIGQAIDDAVRSIADIVDDTLTSALAARGCFRVHRAWSASAERDHLARAAAEAAVRVVLANGWTDVPDEILAIWTPCDHPSAHTPHGPAGAGQSPAATQIGAGDPFGVNENG